MSEEKQGFFGQLKNQIITGVGVILTGLGGLFMDEVKSFIGIEDSESSAVEVVQEQNVNVEGPTINVIIPEQKKDTVVKKVYIKPKVKKKEKEEEIDW
jgi:hypothetical protein